MWRGFSIKRSLLSHGLHRTHITVLRVINIERSFPPLVYHTQCSISNFPQEWSDHSHYLSRTGRPIGGRKLFWKLADSYSSCSPLYFLVPGEAAHSPPVQCRECAAIFYIFTVCHGEEAFGWWESVTAAQLVHYLFSCNWGSESFESLLSFFLSETFKWSLNFLPRFRI